MSKLHDAVISQFFVAHGEPEPKVCHILAARAIAAASAARGLSGEQIMDAWLRTGHSKDEFLSVHYDFALNVLATAKGDGHAD